MIFNGEDMGYTIIFNGEDTKLCLAERKMIPFLAYWLAASFDQESEAFMKAYLWEGGGVQNCA